ncbi:MAG: hypothetical protein R6U89_04745 [Dehalococcoidia bacterium]
MVEDYSNEIEYALSHTEIVRPPMQRLNTFGNTSVHYYLLTEPMDSVNETRIREGRVIAERPRIVTADYFLNAFEGFGEHASDQAREMLSRLGYSPDIMEYKYRNEDTHSWVLSEEIGDVAIKLASKIDYEDDPMAAILKGPDDAWQVSLLQFIMQVTRSSLSKNIHDLNSHGLFQREQGIPKFIREEIEDLFRQVQESRIDIDDLGSRLQSYGLFESYQDRFFALFHRNR